MSTFERAAKRRGIGVDAVRRHVGFGRSSTVGIAGRRRVAAALLVAVFAAGAIGGGCGEVPGAGERAVVFAAASLGPSFEALAREFERREPGARLDVHVAGTPQLVLQVREGAPADVFASADEENVARVLATGVAVGEPVTFARNRLAIVTRAGNPHALRGLSDLARPGLRVVLCGPEVPAGRYARRALQAAGVDVDSVSDEPSVRAVVSKVELGEVDAGLVYATDVRLAAGRVASVAIPDEHNVVARYPIVALGAGESRALGQRFVAFVLSDDGQVILERFGFERP